MYLEGAFELIKRGFRVDRGDLERILRINLVEIGNLNSG